MGRWLFLYYDKIVWRQISPKVQNVVNKPAYSLQKNKIKRLHKDYLK